MLALVSEPNASETRLQTAQSSSPLLRASSSEIDRRDLMRALRREVCSSEESAPRHAASREVRGAENLNMGFLSAFIALNNAAPTSRFVFALPTLIIGAHHERYLSTTSAHWPIYHFK